ncbi:hypothetical protein GMRT_10579 [Giardia muris]|uniref:Uncharacterized protein n=1 Tax=Giardia muris TaxID=5742 RepID=A0A4Z1SMC5_GIAMU|nr:hypothetical protein GMRT_10579 [Giardia muris]|eukprot:TNJ26842.1 hypothetical protein GMRT_10579 [Giardia muris]
MNVDAVFLELFPQLRQGGPSDRFSLRYSRSERARLGVTCGQIAVFNSRLTSQCLGALPLGLKLSKPPNIDTKGLAGRVEMLFAEYPGACYQILKLIHTNRLDLYALAMLDQMTLQSEGVSLDLHAILTSTLGLSPIELTQGYHGRYLLTSGSTHLFGCGPALVVIDEEYLPRPQDDRRYALLSVIGLTRKEVACIQALPCVLQATMAVRTLEPPTPFALGLIIHVDRHGVSIATPDAIFHDVAWSWITNLGEFAPGSFDALSMDDVTVSVEFLSSHLLLAGVELRFHNSWRTLMQATDGLVWDSKVIKQVALFCSNVSSVVEIITTQESNVESIVGNDAKGVEQGQEQEMNTTGPVSKFTDVLVEYSANEILEAVAGLSATVLSHTFTIPVRTCFTRTFYAKLKELGQPHYCYWVTSAHVRGSKTPLRPLRFKDLLLIEVMFPIRVQGSFSLDKKTLGQYHPFGQNDQLFRISNMRYHQTLLLLQKESEIAAFDNATEPSFWPSLESAEATRPESCFCHFCQSKHTHGLLLAKYDVVFGMYHSVDAWNTVAYAHYFTLSTPVPFCIRWSEQQQPVLQPLLVRGYDHSKVGGWLGLRVPHKPPGLTTTDELGRDLFSSRQYPQMREEVSSDSAGVRSDGDHGQTPLDLALPTIPTSEIVVGSTLGDHLSGISLESGDLHSGFPRTPSVGSDDNTFVDVTIRAILTGGMDYTVHIPLDIFFAALSKYISTQTHIRRFKLPILSPGDQFEAVALEIEAPFGTKLLRVKALSITRVSCSLNILPNTTLVVETHSAHHSETTSERCSDRGVFSAHSAGGPQSTEHARKSSVQSPLLSQTANLSAGTQSSSYYDSALIMPFGPDFVSSAATSMTNASACSHIPSGIFFPPASVAYPTSYSDTFPHCYTSRSTLSLTNPQLLPPQVEYPPMLHAHNEQNALLQMPLAIDSSSTALAEGFPPIPGRQQTDSEFVALSSCPLGSVTTSQQSELSETTEISVARKDDDERRQQHERLSFSVVGYVRYHFPSFGIAFISFVDPYRGDKWTHSVAVWTLPHVLTRPCVVRNEKLGEFQLSESKGSEKLFFTRARIGCTVTPVAPTSTVYIASNIVFLDYVSLPRESMGPSARLLQASVYWQEIKKGDTCETSYGFARLSSGHERHFYLRNNTTQLGRLVYAQIISTQPNLHPNSCELHEYVLQPPQQQQWLLGRLALVLQGEAIAGLPAKVMKAISISYRSKLSTYYLPRRDETENLRQVLGFIVAEGYQNTHVDCAFFRLVLPESVAQRLKVGMAVRFTLKEGAYHKVVDESDFLSPVPCDLLNALLKGLPLSSRHSYRMQTDIDKGNSMKLSCWAVDNISLPTEEYGGAYANLTEKKCYGIKPDASFFSTYNSYLASNRTNLIYLPRPALGLTPPVFRENERYNFGIFFVYNEQKMAASAEANALVKHRRLLLDAPILGRVCQLQGLSMCDKVSIYAFLPARNQTSSEGVGRYEIMSQITSDTLASTSDAFVFFAEAIFDLHEKLHAKYGGELSSAGLRLLQNDILDGKYMLWAEQVCLRLVSAGEFNVDAPETIRRTFARLRELDPDLQLPAVDTHVDPALVDRLVNRKHCFWCRTVECFAVPHLDATTLQAYAELPSGTFDEASMPNPLRY